MAVDTDNPSCFFGALFITVMSEPEAAFSLLVSGTLVKAVSHEYMANLVFLRDMDDWRGLLYHIVLSSLINVTHFSYSEFLVC